VTLSGDIIRDLWHKLLWNAGFNAICAVTGATAGEALATPASERMVREAMREVVAVAAAHGVALTDADVDEMAAPDPELWGYRPSTARDLDAGKRLERDALCGFLAREGTRLGVPTPVNAVLDALLALQEDRALRR
jgi:2-dehydropantoate 2-reductase